MRRRRLARTLRGLTLAVLVGVPVPVAAQPGGSEPEGSNGALDCLIEPQQTVVVSASVIGVVESVRVDRGDVVEEGQVLATLEASVEKAMVASARERAKATAEIEGSEARFTLETRHRDRIRQLFEQGVVSDIEVDEAETRWVATRIERDRALENGRLNRFELERARAALALRTVRSPIQGVVVERILAPGEYADPPQLLELAQIDPLRVEVFAPVSLLGTLEVGMRGRVVLEQPIGTAHEAKVVIVDHVVDAASGTFGVRLELSNPDLAIPAGLKCRVSF